MKKISHIEKMRLFTDIFNKELMPLIGKKGKDYSGENDAFSNLNDFGFKGVIVRLGDKYHRIKNIVKSGTIHIKDESIEDTLKDLINYGFIALAMYRLEKDNDTK